MSKKELQPKVVQGFIKWSIAGEVVNCKFDGAKPVTLSNGDKAIIIYAIDADNIPVAIWGNRLLISQMKELGVQIGNRMKIEHLGEIEGKAYKYYNLRVSSEDCTPLLKGIDELTTDDLPF